MIVKLGFLENSDSVPVVAKLYEEYRSYMEAFIKIPVELLPIPDPFAQEGNITLDVDMYMPPVPLEKLISVWHSHGGSASGIYQASMFSANPKPFVKSHLSLFKIGKQFQLVTLAHLLLVSLLLLVINYCHLPIFSKSKSKRKSRGKRFKIMTIFVYNMSAFCRSFILKGVPNIPKILSARLLFGGWLLGVQIFNMYLACNMQSDLTAIEYETIDTFEDFIRHHEDPALGYIEGTASKEFIHNKIEYQSLHESFRLVVYDSLVELLDEEFFEKLFDRTQVWLVFDQAIKIIANIILDDRRDTNLYVSKQPIINSVMVNLIRKNQSQELLESIYRGNVMLFDCDVFQIMLTEQDTHFSWKMWEPPPQDLFNSVSLGDVIVIFLVLGSGYVLALFTVIVEILIGMWHAKFHVVKHFTKSRSRWTKTKSKSIKNENRAKFINTRRRNRRISCQISKNIILKNV